MVIEQLLSGLFGALAATIITVVYLHISEKYKLRSEVFLEVVSYCDEIYQYLQILHVYKKAEYTNSPTTFSPDDYNLISNKLTVLLLSTKTHAKLKLAYGEGETLALLNKLSQNFRSVSNILRQSTRSGWVKEDPEIFSIFSKEIDPLRTDLQDSLFNGTRYLPTYYKICGYFKHRSRNKSANQKN